MPPLPVFALGLALGGAIWPALQPPLERCVIAAVLLLGLALLRPRTAALALAAAGLCAGLALPSSLPQPPTLLGDWRLKGRVATAAWGAEADVAVTAAAATGGAWAPLDGRVRVRFPGVPPPPGTGVVVEGAAGPPDLRRLPGAPDPGWALAQSRVATILRARTALRLGPPPPMPRVEGAANAGLLRAMLDGDRSGIPTDTADRLRNTGTWHLVSISGLHIGLSATVAWGIAWVLSRPLALVWRRGGLKWFCALASIAAAFSYAAIAGWPLPAIRAAWMSSAVAVCAALHRRPGAWELLAFAFLGAAWAEPAAVANAGCQLSFGALIGMLLVEQRVTRWLPPDSPAWLSFPVRGLATTLGATLGTLPVVALRFQTLSPLSPLANLWAVPLVGSVATPTLLASQILPGFLGRAALWFSDHVTSLALAGLTLFDTAPLHPATGGWGALALVGAVFLRRHLAAWALVTCCALGLRGVPRTLTVTFLAIGQGDAALVEWPDGATWLIDGGPPGDGLLQALRRRGIRRLDKVILSHPHPDHLGGLLPVLRELPADELWIPRLPRPGEDAFSEAINATDAFRRIGARPSLLLQVLHPLAGFAGPAADPVNDESLVVRFGYGARTFLFPGDVEAAGEAALLGSAPRADVLKVPHHGSRTSSSAALLAAVAPRMAVASCGASNRYGHPHAEVLARYRGVALYRTDRDGNVTIDTDGESLRVRTGETPEPWRLDGRPLRDPTPAPRRSGRHHRQRGRPKRHLRRPRGARAPEEAREQERAIHLGLLPPGPPVEERVEPLGGLGDGEGHLHRAAQLVADGPEAAQQIARLWREPPARHRPLRQREHDRRHSAGEAHGALEQGPGHHAEAHQQRRGRLGLAEVAQIDAPGVVHLERGGLDGSRDQDGAPPFISRLAEVAAPHLREVVEHLDRQMLRAVGEQRHGGLAELVGRLEQPLGGMEEATPIAHHGDGAGALVLRRELGEHAQHEVPGLRRGPPAQGAEGHGPTPDLRLPDREIERDVLEEALRGGPPGGQQRHRVEPADVAPHAPRRTPARRALHVDLSEVEGALPPPAQQLHASFHAFHRRTLHSGSCRVKVYPPAILCAAHRRRPMPAFLGATNPRLLTRALEQIAAGNRRPRAIAELLGVESRVLDAYLRAATWLGLAALEPEAMLTRAGLEYVYAGRSRSDVYRELVLNHPFVRACAPGGEPPSLDRMAEGIRLEEPGLSPQAARRHALALRRLIEPALRAKAPSRRTASDEQQSLCFSSPRGAPAPVDLRAGADDNPDVYALIYGALLDHGELTPAQARGLLDAAGGRECGIGGYLAMAERRGDARRAGDVLVVTPAAIDRRDLADSAVSIALSDPDFRRHLGEVLAGRDGDARRFRPWMARLFGGEPVAAALDRLLFGRSLASFPLADGRGDALPVEAAPFLAVAARRDLPVAFPASLLALSGGLSLVNSALRQGPAVRPPGAMDRRVAVHGGLLHPGEAPPRVVPDLISLRARALRNAPAFAILAAFGVLDRRGALRMRVRGLDVVVEVPGQPARRLDAVVQAFAHARGWTLVRGPTSTPWCDLVDVGEQLGLFAQPGGCATLDESLFRRLQSDPEHHELWEGLVPLADLIEARACR